MKSKFKTSVVNTLLLIISMLFCQYSFSLENALTTVELEASGATSDPAEPWELLKKQREKGLRLLLNRNFKDGYDVLENAASNGSVYAEVVVSYIQKAKDEKQKNENTENSEIRSYTPRKLETVLLELKHIARDQTWYNLYNMLHLSPKNDDHKFEKLLRELAVQGNLMAMSLYGSVAIRSLNSRYDSAFKVPLDEVEYWTNKTLEQGVGTQALDLGYHYWELHDYGDRETRSGGTISPEKAIFWMEKAAKLDTLDAKKLLTRWTQEVANNHSGDPAELFKRAQELRAQGDDAYFIAEEMYYAYKKYLDASEKGSAYADAQLAKIISQGWGGNKQDLNRAKHLSQRAKQNLQNKAADDAYAEYLLGGLADFIDGDQKTAFQFYQSAANKGLAYAQSALGRAYKYGKGTKINNKKALVWLKKAAAQGYPNACNELGILYQEGIAVDQDFAKAKSLFEFAADKGSEHAMYNMGMLFKNGEGVDKDELEAMRWFKKAALKGHSESESYISEESRNARREEAKLREFFQVSPTAELKYYKAPADAGDAAAQNKLGEILLKGSEHVAKDPAQAFIWFSKSAAQGNDLGQLNLARSYENGWGVAEDKIEARKWYKKAVTQGNKDAKDELEWGHKCVPYGPLTNFICSQEP